MNENRELHEKKEENGNRGFHDNRELAEKLGRVRRLMAERGLKGIYVKR